MLYHRATLIQDIREYLSLLQFHVNWLLGEYHCHCGITVDDAIKWIIAEELELIYGLFTRDHMHNRIPYAEIHSRLDGVLPTTISVLTSSHIRAPQLYVDPYNDNVVDIKIIGPDLYIQYFTSRVFTEYPLTR